MLEEWKKEVKTFIDKNKLTVLNEVDTKNDYTIEIKTANGDKRIYTYDKKLANYLKERLPSNVDYQTQGIVYHDLGIYRKIDLMIDKERVFLLLLKGEKRFEIKISAESSDNPSYIHTILTLDAWLRDESLERLPILLGEKTIKLPFSVLETMSQEELKERNIRLSFEDLELSSRPYIILKREGYHTLEDVMSLTKEDLEAFAQLGKKSIEEILERCEQLRKVYEKTTA